MAVKVHWMEHEPNSRELEYHFTGLSTDEKPNNKRVAVNSLFLELDTGDFYYLKSPFVEGETVKTLLYEEVITSWQDAHNYYFASTPNVELDLPDTLLINWDGTEYECSQTEDGTYITYGAPYDSENDSFDFTSYPFDFGYVTDEYEVDYHSEASGTHTIKVYSVTITQDTPAVWEKIGSGGVEPEPTGELLFNGSVTTEEDGGDYYYAFDQNSLLLNYSSIIVELDGTRYTLERLSGSPDSIFAFGDDDDFSTYPLFLESVIQVGGSVWDTDLYTAEEKTYSFKIWANSDPVNSEEQQDISN